MNAQSKSKKNFFDTYQQADSNTNASYTINFLRFKNLMNEDYFGYVLVLPPLNASKIKKSFWCPEQP